MMKVFLWRVDRLGKVAVIRYPETGVEIIKSSDTTGIADREAERSEVCLREALEQDQGQKAAA